MVVAGRVRVSKRRTASARRRAVRAAPVAALGQPHQPALDPLRASRGPGSATNSVSSPAIEPATSGQRARSSAAAIACAEPGQRAQDEQQAGLVDLDRQVGQQLAQAVLARRLGLDQPRRQRVGRRSPRARP